MSGERIGCCILGCRRTARRTGDETEIMCGKHWRTIDLSLRDRHRAIVRRGRKVERLLRFRRIQERLAVRGIGRLADLFDAAEQRAWDACKLDATIKAALGAEDAPRRRPAA